MSPPGLVMQWAADDVAADSIAVATFVLPPLARGSLRWRARRLEAGDGTAGPGFWNAILAAAGREGRAVAVLTAPVAPGAEAVGVLLELLDSDEMYGAAAARVQCWDGCCLQTVAHVGGDVPAWVPLAVLADLPAHELLGDVLTPCVVLKPVVLTDFADVEPPLESLAGTVAHRLISARKCGFRTALANRAVVRMPGVECERRRNPGLDSRRRFEPRGGFGFGARSRVVRGPWRCARAVRKTDRSTAANPKRRPAIAAAGYPKRPGRRSTARPRRRSARRTGCTRRRAPGMFPCWRTLRVPRFTISNRPSPAGTPTRHDRRPAFTAALRLSQPWHIEEIVDLHHRRPNQRYLMLDTIAWDVQYVAPPHLDGTWRFLANAADGLLFISDFSRQRFTARFSEGRGSRLCGVPLIVRSG